ncbi:delta-60 repeat domain-containing protein [Kitasatospora sp. NPDC008115]|uniref:delta-60 repeat domain-containing protein n=1 Tax=Kitasatospora sp. NPDC008115 TaxID=3364022 RepID=UPI0036E763F4
MRTISARRLAAAAGIAIALVTAVPASAVPGALDPTFGTGGKVVTDFGATPSLPDLANALAIQPSDGKIVTAGRDGLNIPAAGGNAQFALARYNTNGTLDTTFGATSPVPGTVTFSFLPVPNTNFARAVAIQPSDGKIVVAGLAGPNEQTANIAIARLNTDGTLDTSFGTGGKVLLNVSGGLGDGIRGLVVQPDGKIVGAGAAGPNALLVRLNTNGSLDTTFGGGLGLTTLQLGASSHFFGLAQRNDGKLVTGGFNVNVLTANTNFLAARFNTDGSLDTTFGTAGSAHVSFGLLSDLAFGIALTNGGNNGKIVLAGLAQSIDPFNIIGAGAFGLTELNADGSLNLAFGTLGKTTTKVSLLGDEARAVTIGPAGKIYAVGESNEISPFPLDPNTGVQTIVRYTSNGLLDTSWGTAGVVTTSFGTGGASARGAAIDSSNRLVTGGAATVTKPDLLPGFDFTAARYQTN